MASTAAAPRYQRCYTCGRYHPPQEAYKQIFCSRQCSFLYVACPTCGRYHRAPQSEGPHYCSTACSVRYRAIGRSVVEMTQELTASAPAR